MAHGAPARSRYTSGQFFALVKRGVLRPDDRVELLEGVIVTMAPQSARHASATRRVCRALDRIFGDGAVISTQLPFLAGRRSVPEPDVAVLPGRPEDYDEAHPSRALLVVEVADASLAQDRLTKAALYARAGVPEYWVVNLRDRQLEIYRQLDRRLGCYTETRVLARGMRVEGGALGPSALAVDDLLPWRPARAR